MPTSKPRAASSACSSAKVTSGVSATQARMNAASASIRPDLRSPPCGMGAKDPCLDSCETQRIALDALTLNRAAAWWQDSPPS